MTSASEYLYSSNGRYPTLNYGSSHDYEMVCACFTCSGSIVCDLITLSCHKLLKYGSAPKSAIPSRLIEQSAAPSQSALVVTIPSCTMSTWGKKQFVSYKIAIQTDDDRWTVRRNYSDFVTLHQEVRA